MHACRADATNFLPGSDNAPSLRHPSTSNRYGRSSCSLSSLPNTSEDVYGVSSSSAVPTAHKSMPRARAIHPMTMRSHRFVRRSAVLSHPGAAFASPRAIQSNTRALCAVSRVHFQQLRTPPHPAPRASHQQHQRSYATILANKQLAARRAVWS